jgi:glucose/arabinose dehydrogenase
MHNGKLYVAEKNSIKRYSWNESDKTATFEKKLLDLPGNQNHIYRTLVFGNDIRMYISIGSNCNVCVEPNPKVGTVIVANEDGTNARVFAKGQRNAPFMALNPSTGEIWSTGMGRDYLGDNLPPDEINILREGGDYGWPSCYGNKIHDTNFDKKQYIQNPCKDTIAPIFEIPAHSAPLGLAFIPKEFSAEWAGDLLVAYHGSWNRSTKTGYKVVRMTVKGNRITGAEDFITGFLEGNIVNARPVDLLFDKKGNLFVSDDKSGYVFVVSKTQ